MSTFINADQFAVQRVGDQTWKLLGPLIWRGSYRHTVVVAEGFVTDFATSPWYTWWLIPKTGKWTLAATVHDWLCDQLNQRHRRLRSGAIDGVEPLQFGPVDTDGAFRAMLRDANVDPVRRWLMWTGVRWGALLNPARRSGWWRTWQVWPISALVLTVGGGAGLGFAGAVAWAMGWTG